MYEQYPSILNKAPIFLASISYAVLIHLSSKVFRFISCILPYNSDGFTFFGISARNQPLMQHL
jgi:hypothetical protein